jgi:hypothetical protein
LATFALTALGLNTNRLPTGSPGCIRRTHRDYYCTCTSDAGFRHHIGAQQHSEHRGQARRLLARRRSLRENRCRKFIDHQTAAIELGKKND